MEIADRLKKFSLEIPESVKLIAVSKTKSVDVVLSAYRVGQRVFGENKVQELVEKQTLLPSDIEWHYIGHLQTNKVKFLAPFINMIHAVDSKKLLLEINKQAKKHKRVIPCLLQIHIAVEETKFGLSEEELNSLLENLNFQELENVRICGLMGMASLSDDEAQIRQEFQNLKLLFEQVRSRYQKLFPYFTELSMGMSGDYSIAIGEGSTMIRVGSLIFGARQ